MAVIFRFEKQYYEKAGIPVTFVGHPLVGKVTAGVNPAALRARLDIAEDARVVGLFPGSRHSEISRLLPLMFATARRMQAQDSSLRFLLPVASTRDFDAISRQARASGVDIRVTSDDVYGVIASCDAIVTCSGTVTLEVALLGVPMCIVYKMAPLSFLILKRLVTIPHIGLVNIVAQRAVVRELLQGDASPEAIAQELQHLLDDEDYRATIAEGLEMVRRNLGSGNGALNMAELVLSLLPAANTET
jgi:lipid-A-disaccharide synthase